MLLPKVTGSRPFRLFKIYAAWVIFGAALLVLVNAFSSLDEIRAYGFHAFDMVLSYAFLIFWGCLEAILLTVALVFFEVLLEAALRKNLETAFRLIVVALFIACWISGLLAIFRII